MSHYKIHILNKVLVWDEDLIMAENSEHYEEMDKGIPVWKVPINSVHIKIYQIPPASLLSNDQSESKG